MTTVHSCCTSILTKPIPIKRGVHQIRAMLQSYFRRRVVVEPVLKMVSPFMAAWVPGERGVSGMGFGVMDGDGFVLLTQEMTPECDFPQSISAMIETKKPTGLSLFVYHNLGGHQTVFGEALDVTSFPIDTERKTG